MGERIFSTSGSLERLDRYLRRSDSVFAALANFVSSDKGENYLNSRCKRLLDLAVFIPAAIVVTPVITILGFAKKIEDGGSMFFVQERVSNRPGETIDLIKIRSMRPKSDNGKESLEIARGARGSENPNNTRLGSFMRRYQLDELPQFFQVVSGELSLMGTRPNVQHVFDHLKDKWSEERFRRWKAAYQSGPLGISGVTQIFGPKLKEDERRYHTDVFYTKNASLGLDLYLLWRTIVMLVT